MEVSESSARRSALYGLKLRALVREHGGERADAGDDGESRPFIPGAALVRGGEAWVLLEDRPAERLGAALAWAMRAGASDVHVLAEHGTGVLARRAAAFALPISVWHVDGRHLWPAVTEPLLPPPPPPAHHEPFRALIISGGATATVEHGVLVGEVAGLEVCRVVDDPNTGETRLEVGVGGHDREAFTMLYGAVPSDDALHGVVAAVATHRRWDAAQHPLNQLGRERLLRARLIEAPSLIGARRLAAAQPPTPRLNVKDPTPCVATGEASDGSPLVVVCSVGVDLELVPVAADARSALPGEVPRLALVTRRRDRLAITEQLAASLVHPATLVSIDE